MNVGIAAPRHTYASTHTHIPPFSVIVTALVNSARAQYLTYMNNESRPTPNCMLSTIILPWDGIRQPIKPLFLFEELLTNEHL